MNIPLGRYWRLLSTYLRAQRPRVALLAALLGAGVLLQLVHPQIVRRFIDLARGDAPLDSLTAIAALFLGLALLKYVLGIATTYLSEIIGWTATNALRADLALHCLKLDMSFHTTRTAGELIERVDGDVGALSSFFSQLTLRVLANLVLLVGVLAALYLEDWRIGAVFTAYAAAALAALMAIRNLATPYLKESRQAGAELSGYIGEALSGLEDLRSSGAGGYVLQRLYAHSRAFLRKSLRAWYRVVTVRTTTGAVFIAGVALSLASGGVLFQSGSITLGTVYLLYGYVQLIATPLQRITEQLQNLQDASASILRLDELYHTPIAIRDQGRHQLAGGPLSVAFDGVTFGYADDRPVLHDLSFDLAPGRRLGLLGRTGSGKTSIARLLFRLYEPQTGAVRVGPHDVQDVALASLRARVGMVTQDVQLFHATVRENLTLFDERIDDAKLRDVIDELGLGEWFRALPSGLDTELHTGGASLSAGEAQLLALTRVFLKDPGLVVLDEASSRLDPATERLLERALDRLLRDRTGIVIAHRLATVQRADEILVLEHGRIREHGPRAALAADPTSAFAALLRTGLEDPPPAAAGVGGTGGTGADPTNPGARQAVPA